MTWVAIIGLVISYFIFKSQHEQKLRKSREEAAQAYGKALRDLRQEPSNSEIHAMALSEGRYYASLSRLGSGIQTVDEVSIRNDIDAALPAGGASKTSEPNAPSATPTVEDRIASLERLRSQGHISKEEHSRIRARLLDEV